MNVPLSVCLFTITERRLQFHLNLQIEPAQRQFRILLRTMLANAFIDK